MSKKFLLSCSFRDIKTKKQEFLVPYLDCPEEGHFLGLESGNPYKYGMVVFTGREIVSANVIDKMMDRGTIASGSAEGIELLDVYLSELRRFKIGNVVGVEYNTEGSHSFRLKLVANRLDTLKRPRLP